jgi:hypothetical protein
MTDQTDAPEGGAEATAIAETPAVEPNSEATTEQATGTDDSGQADDAGEATEPKRVPWFQKRIDEVTAKKYEAEREAAYWKGIAEGRTPKEATEPTTASLPRLEDFDYDEAKYQAALTKHITEQAEKAIDEKLTRREREQTEAQKNESAIAKLRAGEAKHPDFIAAVSVIQATEAVRDFLLAEDGAPSILYELGKDSAAAERFNTLSPVQQAIELGRRAATPKATTRTIPPPPPTTVAGLASGIGKTPDEMSMAEYAAWVKERDKT